MSDADGTTEKLPSPPDPGPRSGFGVLTWQSDSKADGPITAVEADTGTTHAPFWYEPRLDVLRFIAFFCVFLSHNLDVSSFAPGWARERLGAIVTFGLTLFFVLSAFLLTRLIVFEVAERGSFNLRRYFQRRILRIWPLYFAILLVAILATAALSALPDLAQTLGVEPQNVLAPHEVPSFAFFFANWYLPLTESPGNFLPHLWSLSVEEQFYVVLPVLFVLSARWRPFLGLLCIIGLASPAVMISVGGSSRLVSNATITYAFCFAVGILLALSENSIRDRLKRPNTRRALALAGLALWTAYALLIPALNERLQQTSILMDVVIQTILAAVAISVIISLSGRHLSGFSSWIGWLGKRSYGLYVFHWPILQFVTKAPVLTSGGRVNLLGVVVSFAATVVVSALSYKHLEFPFLRWRARLRTA